MKVKVESLFQALWDYKNTDWTYVNANFFNLITKPSSLVFIILVILVCACSSQYVALQNQLSNVNSHLHLVEKKESELNRELKRMNQKLKHVEQVEKDLEKKEKKLEQSLPKKQKSGFEKISDGFRDFNDRIFGRP